MLLPRKHLSWRMVNRSSLLLILRGCGSFPLVVITPHKGSSSQRQCGSNISSCNGSWKFTSCSTINLPHKSRRVSSNVGIERSINVLNAATGSCLFPSLTRQTGSKGSISLDLLHCCRSIHSSLRMSEKGPGLDKDTSEADKQAELTVGDRIIQYIGWLGGFYSRKAVLTRSSKVFYESCIDSVKTEDFFHALKLPNTFQSWFLIAHLHLWMCLVRLKREGNDGQFMIRELVSTFWDDVKQRMSMLGVHSSSVASRSMRELQSEFYGLIIAYEEGLLSDDKTLASAIWRNLIVDKANTDPVQLARMVEYIRKQVHHMDSIDSQEIFNSGSVNLLPFSTDTSHFNDSN